MPRQTLSSVENSFVQGLVTRSTGLNFPENACTDAENCVFDESGRVTRRLGIDYEEDFEQNVVNRDNGRVINNFLWKVAGDFQNVNILVVQVGATLYFYDTTNSTSVSSGLLAGTISLLDFASAGTTNAQVYQNDCQFDSGFGVLFVFHPFLNSFYVELASDLTSVSGTTIRVRIRDFEGVNDGLEVEEEPTSLSQRHRYNLDNQGWYQEHQSEGSGTQTTAPNKKGRWNTLFGVWPANNNIWWIWKDQFARFEPRVVDAQGNITGNKKDISLGNTPAPKGHYILNLYNQNRNAVSGLSNLPTTSAGSNRAAVGAFFAGRVWYSGINHPDYEGRIYFSQIIEREDQFGLCHQINDPTAENKFDLLPSDGGVIVIAEAARILKLVPVGPSLMVFAENGIWAITGSEGVGFRANDYSVNKLAGTPSLSSNSFVSVAGLPMWWNNDGIYVIRPGQAGGFSVESLTDQKIREFYQDIPSEFKALAKGAYNDINKTVQWVYRDASTENASTKLNCNKLITLNLQTGSFSPWTIDADPISINDIFFIQNFGSLSSLEVVVDSSEDTVIDSSAETVVVPTLVSGETFNSSVFGYIVTDAITSSANLTIALERDLNLIDWFSTASSSSYNSNFTTGYKLHGKGIVKFQTHYINLYMDDETSGQFHIRSVWDYATDPNTGRYSTQELITNDGSGQYRYKIRRIRLRGHGLVVQFQVNSVADNPFSIVGWVTSESANRLP